MLLQEILFSNVVLSFILFRNEYSAIYLSKFLNSVGLNKGYLNRDPFQILKINSLHYQIESLLLSVLDPHINILNLHTYLLVLIEFIYE